MPSDRLSLSHRVVLARWEFTVTRPAVAWVFPDGCRDLIIRTGPGRSRQLVVSPLSRGPCVHPLREGERLLGTRLVPGARIDTRGLSLWWRGRKGDASLDDAVIAQHVSLDPRVAEVLDALAEAPEQNASSTSRRLGVSLRTLQRLLHGASLPAPDFWRMLARARRAARAIASDIPLAELAADHGYCDQAHLSRSIRRWFGVSPRALRATPQLQTILAATGYG